MVRGRRSEDIVVMYIGEGSSVRNGAVRPS